MNCRNKNGTQQNAFKSDVSLSSSKERRRKIALILIASSSWVIGRNSSVKTHWSVLSNDWFLPMWHEIDWENCIRLVSVTLDQLYSSETTTFLELVSSHIIIYLFKILFRFIKIRHESQTGSFALLPSSLSLAQWGTAGSKSSFSVIFFFVSPKAKT